MLLTPAKVSRSHAVLQMCMAPLAHLGLASPTLLAKPLLSGNYRLSEYLWWTQTQNQKGFWRCTNKPDTKSHSSRPLHSLISPPLKSSYSLSALYSADIGGYRLSWGQLLARFVLPEQGMQPQVCSAYPGHALRFGTSPTKLSKAARWTGGGQEEEHVLRMERTFSKQHQQLPAMRSTTVARWAAVAATLCLGSRRGGVPCQAQGAS